MPTQPVGMSPCQCDTLTTKPLSAAAEEEEESAVPGFGHNHFVCRINSWLLSRFGLCHLTSLFSRVAALRDAGGDRAAPHRHRSDRRVARVADEDPRSTTPATAA